MIYIIHYINIILSITIIIYLIRNNSNKENFITWFSKPDTTKKLPLTYTCRRHLVKQDILVGTFKYTGHNIYSHRFTEKVINIILNQSNIIHLKKKRIWNRRYII